MDDRYLQVLSQKETLVGVAIFHGPTFIITFANPLVCRMWGKAHQEVINMPLFEALPEATNQGFEELLNSVRVTGIPYVGNQLPVILEREGRRDIAYFNFVYNPLRDEEGVVTEVMVIANEVTSRVETTRQLIAERQSFYDLFMQAPAIIAVVKGPAHVFELANPLYRDLVGNRPIIGKSVREAIPEVEGQEIFELLDSVYTTGKPFVGNETLVRLDRKGDGSIEDGYYDFVYQPTVDEKGHVDGILVHAVEVTNQVHARKKVDEFMGVVSHELKTPVTSIKAFTQVLQNRFRKAGDDASTLLLGKMDAQINKLTSLIEDLLDATKIESGKLQFNEGYFDFNELVEEIIEEIQRTSEKHTIEKFGVIQEDMYGDRDRIGQVLINMLTNAIKYSPRVMAIAVTVAADTTQVTLSVRDFGLGIAKEKQNQVFERFYRVNDGAHNTVPGIGLGMYISAEIIKRQGGKIWLESEAGKGSTFYFSLPLKKRQE